MLEYWVFLQYCIGINSNMVAKIIDDYKTPQNFYNASPDEFNRYNKNKQISYQNRDTLLEKSKILVDDTLKKGYNIVPFGSKNYPRFLKNIYSPPVLLYVWGNEKILNNFLTVSIVGSRNCTQYGVNATMQLSYDMGRMGAVIVSGLALGIDRTAHEGALRARGKTIAVLGCGLDVDYPLENKSLKEKIVEQNSIIITEYPLGIRPMGQNFPIRNRIMSGLSVCTVVVEADDRSGSLITANLALEQGRDVFAVPGSIFSNMSNGPLKLMQDGAKPIGGAIDILNEYRGMLKFERIKTQKSDSDDIDTAQKNEPDDVLEQKEPENEVTTNFEDRVDNNTKTALPTDDLDEEMLLIYNTICDGKNYLDDIIDNTKLNSNTVLSKLTELEILGYVKVSAGGKFSLFNE